MNKFKLITGQQIEYTKPLQLTDIIEELKHKPLVYSKNKNITVLEIKNIFGENASQLMLINEPETKILPKIMTQSLEDPQFVNFNSTSNNHEICGIVTRYEIENDCITFHIEHVESSKKLRQQIRVSTLRSL